MSESDEARAEARAWMLERPQLREVFEHLPVGCSVLALRPLVCPAPGEIGIVCSYFDNGQVSVICEGNPIRGNCDAEWLEPVSFQHGITPEFVREVFSEVVRVRAVDDGV